MGWEGKKSIQFVLTGLEVPKVPPGRDAPSGAAYTQGKAWKRVQ